MRPPQSNSRCTCLLTKPLQSRRNVLLYAGAAVTGIAGLAALLNGGGGDSGFGDVDSKERSSIGEACWA